MKKLSFLAWTPVILLSATQLLQGCNRDGGEIPVKFIQNGDTKTINPGPEAMTSHAENNSFLEEATSQWSMYCTGAKQISPEIPAPNYKNDLVLKAAQKLSLVRSRSFVLYSDIQKLYGQCYGSKAEKGLCDPDQVKGKPADISVDAHNFLTILCSEFRDNENLMVGKLKWVSEMVIVPEGEQSYDPGLGFWEQLTSEGYYSLLELSETLYDLRLRSDRQYNPYNNESELDQLSVPAISECEYRFLLAEYISKGEDYIESLKDYEAGLEKFMASGACSEDEKNHYNEFRGDGNFKPHSLESNAFIWNTRAFARNCKTTTKAEKSSNLSDRDCSNYFSRPFESRKNLTLQGLYRLFFYHPDANNIMKNYSSALVFITDDLNGDDVAEMISLDLGTSSYGASVDVIKNPARYVYNMRESSQAARKDRNYKKADILEGLMKSVLLRASIQELKSLGYSTDDLERVLFSNEKELDQKIPVADEETLANMAKVKELKALVQEKRKLLTALNDTAYETKQKMDEITREIKSIRLEIAEENKDKIEKLQKKIESLKEKNNPDLEKIAALEEKVNALKTQGSSEQMENLSALEEEYSKLETLSSQMMAQTTALYKDIDGYEAEIIKLSKDEDSLISMRDDFDKIATMNNFKGIKLDMSIYPGWDLAQYQNQVDKGFFSTFTDPLEAWERLAIVLDRHTDWYKIDMFALKLGLYQPTYSPWVASSYYIHESDAFTSPGYAMGLEGDGHRHWMFVQRVPKNRWYRASDLKEGKQFDLLNTWFDETTFSTSSLGAGEKGWDRFGSVTPDELGRLVYLYHMGEM